MLGSCHPALFSQELFARGASWWISEGLTFKGCLSSPRVWRHKLWPWTGSDRHLHPGLGSSVSPLTGSAEGLVYQGSVNGGKGWVRGWGTDLSAPSASICTLRPTPADKDTWQKQNAFSANTANFKTRSLGQPPSDPIAAFNSSYGATLSPLTLFRRYSAGGVQGETPSQRGSADKCFLSAAAKDNMAYIPAQYVGGCPVNSQELPEGQHPSLLV